LDERSGVGVVLVGRKVFNNAYWLGKIDF